MRSRVGMTSQQEPSLQRGHPTGDTLSTGTGGPQQWVHARSSHLGDSNAPGSSDAGLSVNGDNASLGGVSIMPKQSRRTSRWKDNAFDNVPVQTLSGDGAYTAVLIVPTGIGAAIGGYAGDALPVAR